MQLAPGPQPNRGPQFENFPKFELGFIKIGAIVRLRAPFIGIINALEHCQPAFGRVV